jgi:hypothetical protein
MDSTFIVRVFYELTKELSSKKRANRAQLMALIASLLGVILGMTTFLFEHRLSQPESYRAQIESLNTTEQSLRNLITFVESQKKNLVESQAIVESLKKEESKLRPMVEAERELVDSILAISGRTTLTV